MRRARSGSQAVRSRKVRIVWRCVGVDVCIKYLAAHLGAARERQSERGGCGKGKHSLDIGLREDRQRCSEETCGELQERSRTGPGNDRVSMRVSKRLLDTLFQSAPSDSSLMWGFNQRGSGSSLLSRTEDVQMMRVIREARKPPGRQQRERLQSYH